MSAVAQPRIALLHGPNLGMLARRPAQHYGSFTLAELERMVRDWGAERGMRVGCFQTDHEGAFLQHVHGITGIVDGVVVNPGAWTHYQWSIRDALETVGAPFVEVHISDVEERAKTERTAGSRSSARRRSRRCAQGPGRTVRPWTSCGAPAMSDPRPDRRARLRRRARRAHLGALVVTHLGRASAAHRLRRLQRRGRDRLRGRRTAHRLYETSARTQVDEACRVVIRTLTCWAVSWRSPGTLGMLRLGALEKRSTPQRGKPAIPPGFRRGAPAVPGVHSRDAQEDDEGRSPYRAVAWAAVLER
ncbi:MAG: type II 3-dehydroquinate dehydratase [Thermoleophilia bacterium]